MKSLHFLHAALLIGILASCLAARPAAEQGAQSTTIYFVRHGEVDMSDATYPLDEKGFERARELVDELSRAPLTHVFASHTLRSRQAVAEVAKAHGLAVVPLPPLGSKVGDSVVTGVSPSRLAVGPLSDALEALPPGSVALVGVNSDNLFAILNHLGVRVATQGDPCELGSTCVPCLDNSCFPTEFDNLWVLVRPGDGGSPALMWLKY